jgi:hypothetical protein
MNLNVNLEIETIRALEAICNGNRSAAIEALVREHLERNRPASVDA